GLRPGPAARGRLPARRRLEHLAGGLRHPRAHRTPGGLRRRPAGRRPARQRGGDPAAGV
ncbi:MAG: hypothetical protein AVDCRST_MAG52-656, partial [uncultured Blastococcus sp.]